MRAGSGLRLRELPRDDAQARRIAVLEHGEVDRRDLLLVLERDGFDAFGVSADEVSAPPGAADVIVVLTDGVTGDEGWSALLDGSTTPIVVVAPLADRATIADGLADGAVGFVAESDLEARLGPTISAVAAGQLAIPAEYRDAVAQPILSPRERQVMSMVVLGFTNVEVANKLHVSEQTVKSHLSSVYRKLRVSSRHEATALILTEPRYGLGILALAGERASH